MNTVDGLVDDHELYNEQLASAHLDRLEEVMQSCVTLNSVD